MTVQEKTDVDYWNECAGKTRDEKQNMFRDNLGKRRLMMKLLLEHDFSRSRILEVGVGNGLIGYLTKVLNSEVHYRGIDISDVFLKHIKDLRIPLDVRFGRITEIPFEDKSFNTAFMFDVLEHIKPEERPLAYRELDRVLENDNRAIFINNPISKSDHDDAFDYGFFDKDIQQLAETLDMRIGKVELIQYAGYYYQFVVLTKVIYKKLVNK